MKTSCKILKPSVRVFAIAAMLVLFNQASIKADATPTATVGQFFSSAGSSINAVPLCYKIPCILALLAAYRFNMKDPSNDKARYDWSKLNTKNLWEDPKTFVKHAWYVLDDFIIGRASEDKGVEPKFDKNSQSVRLAWSTGHPPQGLGGNIHTHVLFPLKTTFAFPTELFETLGVLGVGVLAWSTWFNAQQGTVKVVNK